MIEEPADIHELRGPVDYAMSGPTEKVNEKLKLEMCWENHHNIMVSSGMFPS